ncbi:MAG TPA: hypothetical protein VMP38_00995 [Candidatus Acidoferrum sp.]|nr:hypothetical protein [Candidatus Acidoferrum sp.]
MNAATTDLQRGALLSRSVLAPRRLLAIVAVVGVGTTMVATAYVLMFSGHAAYDDEGFFLTTVRDYLSGESLLTPYVPLYGPFYYEVTGALFRLLGSQPTLDTGRWITLVVWLLTSATSGGVAYLLTRTRWIGLAASLVTFLVLVALTNEPMSTYGLTSLLLILLAGAAAQASRWPRASAALIGAIVGALWLTKVNVGVFAAVAVAFVWTATLHGRARRLLMPAAALLLAASPLVLMWRLVHEPWALLFAILVALSLASTGFGSLAAVARRGAVPFARVRWSAAGGAALVVACLAGALVSGTKWGDIWTSLFVVPLGFPGVFTLPVRIGIWTDVWAVLSFAVAVAVWSRRAPSWVPRSAAGYGRVGAGLLIWLSAVLCPSPVWLLGVPLAWLMTQAPAGGDADQVNRFSRVLLPALAVMEAMQAYPVGGSEVNMAVVAMVPVGAVLLNDGVRELGISARPDATRTRMARLVAPMVFQMNLIVLLFFVLVGWFEMTTYTSLDLPGARSVRLPAGEVTSLHQLIAAMNRYQCSSLITFPGMNSFFVWTDEAASPEMRFTQWWVTIGQTQQESLVRRFEATGGVCVVKNQRVLDFWAAGRPPPGGPIIDFINSGFVPAGDFGDYQLLVRSIQ